MSVEDSIAKQLNKSQPVQINSRGEILQKKKQTVQSPQGGMMEKDTGRPVTQLKPQRWYSWYRADPERLLHETQVMNDRFPQFKLFETDNGLTWAGKIQPNNNGGVYQIAITYPHNFPYKEAKAYVINPKVYSPKHQYEDGSLCLMYPGDGTWQPNTTAVQIVTMATTWLFCFEYHEQNCPTRCDKVPCKHWPGAEAPH